VFSRVVAGSRDIISLAGLARRLAVIFGTAIGLVVSYEGAGLKRLSCGCSIASWRCLPGCWRCSFSARWPITESILWVIIIVYIPIVARVVRSVVLDIKTRTFVEAARLRAKAASIF